MPDGERSTYLSELVLVPGDEVEVLGHGRGRRHAAVVPVVEITRQKGFEMFPWGLRARWLVLAQTDRLVGVLLESLVQGLLSKGLGLREALEGRCFLALILDGEAGVLGLGSWMLGLR